MVTSRIRIAALSVLLAAAAGSCSASPGDGHFTPSPPSSSEPATPSFADPTGLALDAGGNLWVCNYRGSNMLMFSAADLTGSVEGGPAASVVISGLRGPNDLAFDGTGTLWVVDYDAGIVAGYRPSQLAASGEPSPSVVIGSNGVALSAPTWLAFDPRGWMWVSSQRTGDVVGYRPAQLRRSGDPKPAVVLHMPGGSNSEPEAVAFDRQGHLWVALYGRNEVVRFSSEQLGRSGRPAPTSRIRFEPADGSPIGLAADDEDRLWVVLDAAGVVEAFATSHPSGRPVARVEGGAFTEPHAIAFDSEGSGWVAFHDDVVARYPGAVEGDPSRAPDLVLK